MKSKKQLRRMAYKIRQVKKQYKATLSKNYRCGACGWDVPFYSPICVCGNIDRSRY